MQFLVLAMVMVLATLLVLWRCKNDGFVLPLWWVLVTAAMLRLMSVSGDPLFEDDFYRYLWDGYQTITTNDPYTDAPAAFFDQEVPEGFESILSFINYPEIATVYGPVVQWFFALSYMIDPGKVWPLQLMSGVADIIIICLLSRLGAGNALLLYAWSPLILKEYSLTAHPDVFSVAFMFVSIVSVYRHRAYIAGFAIGLALGAKIFALLVLPFLFSSGWGYRHWLRFGAATALALVFITLWFGSIKIWIPEGLLAMADSWLFNSPLYYLLLSKVDFQGIKGILFMGFIVYAGIAFCRRTYRIYVLGVKVSGNLTNTWSLSAAGYRGDCLFALFLLCLPVINPWYVAWLLPFATLYPRWWSWTASYTILFSYWYGSNVGAIGSDSLQLPVSILSIEFMLIPLVPFMVWLARQYRRKA